MLSGDYVLDEQNEKVNVQKVLISACPRALHDQMMKPESEGGYKRAKDSSGDPRFSLTTLINYMPNWLVQMNDGHKLMCGCKTCTEMDGLHDAMKYKRRKLISETESELRTMADGTDKTNLQAELDEYKSEVLNENGQHKHDKGWHQADEYGCREMVDVDIDGDTWSFAHYSCVLGQCSMCDEKDYQAPTFELGRDGDTIRYSKFTNHHQCKVHKGADIRHYNAKPKVRCGVCEALPEEERKGAKVVKKTFRTIHSEPLSSFVGKKGTYAKQMRKMHSHKHRIRMGSKHIKKKSRSRHAEMRAYILNLERDFAERWQANPNGQAQHEYFNKEVSVGMEGITVLYKPKGKDEYETHFYSILTTEKSQDGNVVYANTRIMLEDVLDRVDTGDDIVGFNEGKRTQLEILESTDGCCVQYRCAVALYFLHKLCAEMDIVYDRDIQPEGHGKCSIDGFNGVDKKSLSNEFRTVEYQPEAVDTGKHSILFHQMEDGQKRDLADLCHDILSRPERANGAVPKIEPKKRRKEAPKKKKTDLTGRKYFVRKKGLAKWSRIRMKAYGFPTGKSNGMKFYYNFRFEKALKQWFAYRRQACSCDGCYKKLQEPSVDARYSGACNTCRLWKIFEKKDGSGKGLNDWKLARFKVAEDCDQAIYHASMADTLRESGKTWASQVVEGNVGAYTVDDQREQNFYFVKWDGEPTKALATEEIEVDGGEKFTVTEGDWYCEGEWLERLKGARGWWTLTGRSCIVRLETVIMADVRFLERSDANPLPPRTPHHSKEKADEMGAWKVSDLDHADIVESAQDMSYLEYDEDLVDDIRDEFASETAWAGNANDANSDDSDNE